jgi:hypothetical protein
VCIAEVEELVEPGQLNPDEIHLPGIYVQRIVKGTFLVLAVLCGNLSDTTPIQCGVTCVRRCITL